MDIFKFAKQYADQIGGQFTDYDHTKAIMVVPLTEGRFQTVLLLLEKGKSSGKLRARLTSKICEFSSSINFQELLEHTASFDYSKFILDEGHLKVEASCLAETASEDEIKHMVQEVANLADTYEKKITGKDIH